MQMINKRFYIGFTIAIGLVLIVGSVSYYTLKRQAAQHAWVEHTYKVLEQATYVEKLLVDMETGRRGFRCTGDKAFLEPYYRSQPKLQGSVEDLGKSVADNPVQVERINQLQADVAGVDSLWRSVNIDIVYRDNEERRGVTLAEKQLMDKVRKDIAAIRAAESSLLAKREEESQAGIQLALWTLIIGVCFILAVVIFMIRLVISENKNRRIAEGGLKDNIAELDKINAETLQSNWHLAGMRLINASLIGNDTLKELVDNCLKSIMDYMQLPCAVFYLYDKQSKELVLNGSVALPRGAKDRLKVNEGITGAAATKRSVTVVGDVPKGYWLMESATGSAAPDTVLCVPLWKTNELIGVIEFGSFSSVGDRNVPLLEEIAGNIAIGISAAHANDLAVSLLVKVQEQRDELESQQEELRQTNDELNHQAEVLRASEEELKTQEEELRQINSELEEKTEAVEQARKVLQEKAAELEVTGKYKSEFLANMSHELRTPLNSVLILASLLKDNKTNNLTPKQADYARIIHKSGTDLLNLINDILDLSKIEAGKIDFHFEEVKVREIALDMEQLFAVVATEKHISFTSTFADNSPIQITTDKQRLEQVIKNLLSNAFKFTPEKGKVNLHFTGHDEHVTISVTDTGIGIPPEKQRLIFEAFQQADGSTSRRYGGTGLGLSISKELIAKLGGEVRLTSSEGAGSTFTLILPIKQSVTGVVPASVADIEVQPVNLDAAEIQEQTEIEDDKPGLKAGERSILIIEDDVVFAKLVNDFAHDKGFKTMIALSGEEGLLYATKYKPSAIILDLGLPGADGRSVLKTLKSDKAIKSIPVHVISAQDRSGISGDDIESYFRKPLISNELDKTFKSIDTYIKQHYKKILIFGSNDSQLRKMFETLSAGVNSGIVYDIAETKEEAIDKLKEQKSDCIIVDIDDNIKAGIATLTELKAASNGAYIITCMEGDISSTDEKQLKSVSDSIIRKSAQAAGRLMDEVELFIHRIGSGDAPVAVPDKYAHGSDKTLEGKTILIADDDMRNVFALTAMLEENGINILAAENGVEAIDTLKNNPGIDMVLMDIMMPEMDGYQAMTEIRKDHKYARLPIIALTAKAMTGDREKCMEAGASDYITKPINNNKLLSLMRVWLSKG